MRLKARKSFTYNTRHLKAGDEFDTKRDMDARILCGIGKAEPVREPAKVAPPPEDIAAKIAAAAAPAPVQSYAPAASEYDASEAPPADPPADPVIDDIAALRAEYREKVGRGPFNGWSAETLRQKIAEASSADQQ